MKKFIYLSLVALSLANYGDSKIFSESDVPMRNQAKHGSQSFVNPMNIIFGSKVPTVTLSTTEEIIAYYKFKMEEHVTTTSDGYHLTLHRIPGNQTNPSPAGKPPVLLGHGLYGASNNWVTNGRYNSLAFLLSDMNYDVWMANFRGSLSSRTHQTLNVNQSEFWDFSWHELGVYDIPAMIDYVLATTKQEQIFYAGHSQGTTAFLVMLSERPENNKKIRAAFSFGGSAYFAHVPIGMRTTTSMLYAMKKSEAPHENILSPAVYLIRLVYPDLMRTIRENNTDVRLKIGSFYTSGTSNKQSMHYAQLQLNNGRFRQYDYGPTINKERYGSLEPPDYKLSNVKVPVTLFYSLNDPFTPEEDVKTLHSKLGNPNSTMFRVEDPKFSHFDFIWGNTVKSLVYKYMTSILFNYMN